jgi:hypothetical protein
MLKRCLKGSAERKFMTGFQGLGVIKMHLKGGDDDMKGVSVDRSAERMFQTVENSGHWGSADQTDLI